MRVRLGTILLALLAAGAGALSADTLISASNNGTIQPGGPRQGANGKRFFNIEGSSNSTFASYGVLDFAFSGPASGTPAGLTLTLTEDNASFTHPGGLAFLLSTDITTSIDPGSSPLVFIASDPPGGIGSQLGTRYALGIGSFTGVDESTNGRADSYTLALSGAALTYLSQQAQTGGRIRILVAATDPATAATFAGFSDNRPGPQLLVAGTNGGSTVPEPASAVLLGLSAATLCALRKVRRTG